LICIVAKADPAIFLRAKASFHQQIVNGTETLINLEK